MDDPMDSSYDQDWDSEDSPKTTSCFSDNNEEENLLVDDDESATENNAELEMVHRELIQLSEQLQLKSLFITETECRLRQEEEILLSEKQRVVDTLASMERSSKEFTYRELELDQRSAIICQQEHNLKLQAKHIDDLVESLITERIGDEREKSNAKLHRLQAHLQKQTAVAKNEIKKHSVEEAKSRQLKSEIDYLKKESILSNSEISRLNGELENAKTKFRVSTWKHAKELKQLAKDHIVSNNTPPIVENPNPAKIVDPPFKSSNVFLLINGLIEQTINAMDSKFRLDIYISKVLPGLIFVLDHRISVTNVETCSNLLQMAIQTFCVLADHHDELEQDGKSTIVARMSQKLATKICGISLGIEGNTRKDVILMHSPDIRVKTLSVITALCFFSIMRVSLDPCLLSMPLEVLNTLIADVQVQATLLGNTRGIDPILEVLLKVSQPSWRVCCRAAVSVILSLSKKGPYQQEFLEVISSSRPFRKVCETVFQLFHEQASVSKSNSASEAVSALIVLLQRLSQTNTGRQRLSVIFRGTNIWDNCKRLIHGPEYCPEDKENIDFISLNATSLISALHNI